MSSQLGKIILLKEEFKKSLNHKNYKEAERILKVIDEEYKNISNKGLKNFLTENICFVLKLQEPKNRFLFESVVSGILYTENIFHFIL